MILLGLILLSSTNFCQTTCYLEETAECARNSSQVEIHLHKFFLGCNSFKELIKQNHVFIDKSLLLREIFQDHSYLTVFYLPPKFSKTINLEMIRFFAEFQLDSNDSIIPYKHTTAYNFFTSGKILDEHGTVEGHLKDPPLISRHIELIDQHVAQHPAIYLDFSLVRSLDFECSWGSYRDNIGREFKRYRFLTSRISPNESSQYMQLLEYFNRTEWVIDSDFGVDLPNSVIFLAKMASKFFHKKPILYIDEYDSLLGMFLHRRYYNEKESEKVLTFFSQFIDAIFTRDDIWHRIVLTGTHGLHSNIISSLEGSKAIYTAFDNDLSHFFGFTEADITAMSKHYPRVAAKQVQQMREYYNGYQMGRPSSIYNPWCVMKFFTTQELINHWESESEYRWFLYNLWGINQMRYLWLDLLSDRADYQSRPFEKFSHHDLWVLRDTLYISMDAETQDSFSLSSKEFTQALMYQVGIGYLTWANYDTPDRETTFNVRVANLEIKKAVFKDMSSSYKMYLNLNVPLADNATAALDSYLFSRQREKFINILTRSFNKLFNQTKEIPEIGVNEIDLQADPVGRRIIEYIGLRLKYQFDHKLDRNIADGFITTKLNVSSVVIFNYNRSVENDHILNQIDNFTHPWTELGPEMTNSSVTYVVIGVKNGTEISIKRYGAEPPILFIATTKAPTAKQKKKGSKMPKFSNNTVQKNEKKGGGGAKSKGKKIPQSTIVGQSPKTKMSKSGSQFRPQVTKALNASFTKKTMVRNGEDLRTDHAAGFRTSPGLKSTSQLRFNVSNFLNESSVVEKTVTKGDGTTRSMKIYANEPTKNHFEKNFTTGSTKSNPTHTTDSSSLTTEGGSSTGSKFSPLITKSLEDLFTNQATLNQVDNESGTSEPAKDHINTTNSVEIKSINTTIFGLTQSSSTISTSNESKSSPEFTSTLKKFTTTSHRSKSILEFNSALTKSVNNSFINEISITQTEINDKKSKNLHTSYSAKFTQNFAENTSFSTFAFAESSLKEFTRVTRSIPVDQSPSTSITSGKSGSDSNPEITKSLQESFKNDTKVINLDTTTSIPSNSTKITLSPSATNSGSKSNAEITKITNKENPKLTTIPIVQSSTPNVSIASKSISQTVKSSTSEIKVTNSNTTVLENPSTITNTLTHQQSSSINASTASNSSQKVSQSSKKSNETKTEIAIADTAAIDSTTPVQPSSSNVSLTSEITKFSKESSTTSIKDASTSSTQTIFSNITTVRTKPSKSGSKSNTKLKVTKSHNGSTFTKRKKGKKFNATAFVKGNFTKFTKFSRGQKSFVNKTTITTTPLTTTEPTTTEMFFPPPRSTRLPRVRRSRTGSKILPRTTTISAMQFWKLFVHVH